jgi:hypothetical protein
VSEHPKALLQLGEELQRVAEETLRDGRDVGRGLRRASGRLSVLAVCVALLILAAAATAAVLLIQQGSPLPAPHSQDLRSSGIPLPGSARLAGLDAPDPDGSEPPWDLRLSRTADGETCTAVGQVLNGRFGIVGLDHVFRALPLGSVDSCGVASPDGPTLLGARSFVGATETHARTVLSGVAGAGARSVTAYAQGSARRLPLGPDGSFITVYAGEAEAVQPRVVIVTGDGRSRSVALEQGAGEEVADPGGGAGWVASTEADLEPNAFPDEDCVQVTRQPSQSESNRFGLPLTPETCGRLARSPLFVQMRRFVPGEEATPFPWGDAPSRTIVYGVATPRVKSRSLTGAGTAKTLSIDRQGGAFLAVLDGHVDPRSLTLVAKLGNGATVAYHNASGLLGYRTNRPQGPAPVPAYRSPRPLKATLPPPFQLQIPSTVRETLSESDPAGGPEWVVRSWQGRPNLHVPGVVAQRYYCEALGVRWDGHLVEPSARPSKLSAPVSPEGRCDGSKELRRLRYSLSLESFLDDPYAYTPTPSRAILSGLLPPEAKDPILLGVGPARTLSVDANHAFLVVLPGRDWNATPRISYLLHGHRVGKLSNPPGRLYQPGTEPRIPQVRAPDPDGAAPWGFAATRTCSTAYGRIVAGRLASIDLRDGVLKPGAEGTGSNLGCLSHPNPLESAVSRDQPVEFDQQQVGTGTDPWAEEPSVLGQPEVEQRTLPGRTIITGEAKPDVLSVTISTPSDVRTLRPSGPLHLILAVYDGYFLRGSIVATARLRDGRVATEQILSPLGGGLQPLPLAARLRDSSRQLRLLRAHASRMGGPAAVGAYEARIRQIERRLEFERTHPGLLPAE